MSAPNHSRRMRPWISAKQEPCNPCHLTKTAQTNWFECPTYAACFLTMVSVQCATGFKPISESIERTLPYLWEPAKNARESTKGRQDSLHLRSCPSTVARCCMQQTLKYQKTFHCGNAKKNYTYSVIKQYVTLLKMSKNNIGYQVVNIILR